MNKEKGFTLLETMIVIAIVSITAAIVIPNIIPWRENRRFSGGAREVYSAIQQARSSAIKMNSTITILFTPGEGDLGKYIAFIDANRDGLYNSPGDTLVIPEKKLPQGVSLLNPKFSSANNKFMRFSPMGFARDEGGTDQNGGFDLSGKNGRSAKITIDVAGNVRIIY